MMNNDKYIVIGKQSPMKEQPTSDYDYNYRPQNTLDFLKKQGCIMNEDLNIRNHRFRRNMGKASNCNTPLGLIPDEDSYICQYESPQKMYAQIKELRNKIDYIKKKSKQDLMEQMKPINSYKQKKTPVSDRKLMYLHEDYSNEQLTTQSSIPLSPQGKYPYSNVLSTNESNILPPIFQYPKRQERSVSLRSNPIYQKDQMYDSDDRYSTQSDPNKQFGRIRYPSLGNRSMVENPIKNKQLVILQSPKVKQNKVPFGSSNPRLSHNTPTRLNTEGSDRQVSYTPQNKDDINKRTMNFIDKFCNSQHKQTAPLLNQKIQQFSYFNDGQYDNNKAQTFKNAMKTKSNGDNFLQYQMDFENMIERQSFETLKLLDYSFQQIEPLRNEQLKDMLSQFKSSFILHSQDQDNKLSQLKRDHKYFAKFDLPSNTQIGYNTD